MRPAKDSLLSQIALEMLKCGMKVTNQDIMRMFSRELEMSQ